MGKDEVVEVVDTWLENILLDDAVNGSLRDMELQSDSGEMWTACSNLSLQSSLLLLASIVRG
jgi:hypothetical protein